MNLEEARTYSHKASDNNVKRALLGLIEGLIYFSKKWSEPSVEFAIPVMRS